MKKTMTFLYMAVLTLVGAMMVGCSNEDDFVQPVNNDRVITLRTTVNIGGEETRALTEAGVKTFEVGDKVGLRYENSGGSLSYVTSEALTTANISSDKKSATLTFTLTNPKASGYVDMIYPITNLDATGKPIMSAYATQDGTFATVQNIEQSSFSGNLTANCELPATITLYNDWAIAKFTVKNTSGQDITSTITSLKIALNGTDCYTINRTAAAGPIYMVIEPIIETDELTITASDGTETYQKIVTGKTLKFGKIYPITITAIKVTDRIVPLTFEAKEAGAVVKFNLISGVTGKVEYSTDGSSWSTYVPEQEITLTNVGDKVMFRGDNATYANLSNSSTFSCSKDCYIYGNIMSLIQSNGYATLTSLTERYTFQKLFEGNTHIVNHTNKPLVLPATTLAVECYREMFSGCTGLTTAPELPATTLVNQCYISMFEGCTGLTSAPELEATTLTINCYNKMFKGCTGLKTAPDLDAENLAEACYFAMFDGCTSLTKAPELNAENLAEKCYCGMFNGCTSLTTAPELNAENLKNNCYAYMFSGCTNLQTAPDLPTTTLTKNCYHGMFSGCTKLTKAPDLLAPRLTEGCYSLMFSGCTLLNSVKCMATDNSATNCTTDWLNNVAETGTLTVATAGIWETNSVSGVPTGWNAVQSTSTSGSLNDYTIETATEW